MSPGTLRIGTRVHFGFGCRAHLPEVVSTYGRRVLAVVDPFLLGTPFFDDTVGALRTRGFDVDVHSGITPELPVDSLSAPGEADVIVAIGGGSALDAAKLLALLSSYDGPLSRYYGENQVPGPVRPVIALPTTAGTGSEVTPVAVVSDPSRELKVGISSPFLVPAAALVDPEFTMASPATVTAYAGIDALVHAVESYTSRPLDLDWSAPLPVFTGRNALSDPLALQAARHLLPWLPVAVASPANREARREVAMGALLAGMAFGSTGTHLCHAIQYPLGALTKTPHGLGTGLLLPYVIAVLETAMPDRLADLGDGLRSRVVAINRAIGVPATLAEIGVTRDHLPRIAELALASKRLIGMAPIEPTRDAVLEILHHAHRG